MSTGIGKHDPAPHGGDIYADLLSGKPAPLDFSANISPLGLPDGVKSVLADHIYEYDIYPDPNCRVLTKALASKHHLSKDNIACGAGSSDLIFRIARVIKPKNTLVTAPAFSEYSRAAEEMDSVIFNYPLLHPGFVVTERIAMFVQKVDLVYLGNPNNPTGVLTPRDTIEQILKKCEASRTTLVMDECFMDLTDDPKAFTAEPLLSGYKNLIVLKAFTKTWAMAGLRLGYALCGSAEIAAKIRDTGPPWSVSAPAQIAGAQALKEKEYLAKLRKMIKKEREKLRSGLVYVGADVLGGSANYVFFRMPGRAMAGNLAAALAERGILIRDCSNFNGLEDGTYYRIAVRQPKDNDRLLFELRTMLVK